MAKKKGIKLIQDAAQSLGSTYNKKPITDYSDFTIFSFQAIKHISSGDGGMICIKDKKLIKNSDVTTVGNIAKTYAYCSDTAYDESIIPIIKNVDVLYHESTFLEDNISLCEITKHSTAKQAAIIAKAASVGLLILGHFSSRYKEINNFKLEAKSIFNSVDIAEDGKNFDF